MVAVRQKGDKREIVKVRERRTKVRKEDELTEGERRKGKRTLSHTNPQQAASMWASIHMR